MPFDLNHELADLRRLLAETRALIAGDADELRKRGDFGPRCQVLAERVEKLAAQLPPPEPTPPVTQWEVSVPTVKLAKYRKLLGLSWFSGDDAKPDRKGMVPVSSKRRVRVDLPDPRYPGSPACEQVVEVESTEAVVVEDEEDEEGEEGGFRLVEVEKRPKGGFVYELRPVKIRKTIELPAIPPDAPPTPIQKAYLDERARLAAEVRDLHTFIADVTGQVNESLAASLELKDNVEALVKRVEDLPMPLDSAAEMRRIRERFEEIQRTLPDLTGEMEAAGKRLDELRRQAREICPEWKP